MNKTVLGLIFFLIILNLLGIHTGNIITLIVACLLLFGAALWVWQKQFPKSVLKNIILIVFMPMGLIALGSFFVQSISILNPVDALLVIIVIVAIFWLIPKLLK